MHLPESRRERDALYRNVIRQCEASVAQRRAFNRAITAWYQSGTELGSPARYNKLSEHVQDAAADLYAPESVRFGLGVPRRYGDQFTAELEAARDDFADFWSTSDSGLVIGLGVEMAHVWPSAVFKVIVDGTNSAALHLVPDPADVGVLQEDIDDVDKQEAVCHWYSLSVPAFRRMIRATYGDTALAREIIAEGEGVAERNPDTAGGDLPGAVQNILVLSQASPNMVGNVPALPFVLPPMSPTVREPVVRLAELWIWDDEALTNSQGKTLGEWRVVKNLLATERILWDPINPLNPGEHPFHLLSLCPTPGVLWGRSILAQLLRLQEWHEKHIELIDYVLGLQMDPPYSYVGMMGIQEEKLAAMRSRGGLLVASGQGDVKNQAPPMPPDAFGWLQELAKMFARQGGRPLSSRGMDEAALRSGEQEFARAALAGGPSLTRAMYVEDCLEAIATSMWRLRRRTYGHALRTAPTKDASAGRDFLLTELPAESSVRVSAHSHSPVYEQKLLAKLAFAAQHKWIDADTGLFLLGLPMDEQVRAKSRLLQQSQADRAERVIDIKEAEARAKVMKAQRT